MVTVVGAIGLLIIVGVNAAVAALMTRFFRVRLDSDWGPLVFALTITPVVLVVLTQVLSAVGLGFDLGSAGAVVGVAVVMPLALGIAFDYFWMPAPDDVELPERFDRGETDTRSRRR
jgi:hypothetical protein